MKNNRTLFVAVLDPFKTGGGSQATRAYLDAIIKIFGENNVDVMTYPNINIPKGYANVKFIPVSNRSKITIIFSLLFGVLGRFAVAATKYLKEHSKDYSHCVFNGGLESGWCFKHIKNLAIKKIAIHHNMEVVYCMDTKNILTLKGRFPYLVKLNERNAYKYSDYNLFLTKQDIDQFESVYGRTQSKNALIGTFDYRNAKIVTPIDTIKEYDIVASGTMAHYQTTHGIIDFYNRYLPIVKRLLPDSTVLLTGRNPSTEIQYMQIEKPDTIFIVPNPEDIMSQVLRGRIFLCPTDIGSGLKLRAMDGLKSGLPILVHEVSSRGYDYYFGKPYYKVYNDEETFETGLKNIIEYLNITSDSCVQINQDYYAYFGFNQGVERFKKAITE